MSINTIETRQTDYEDVEFRAYVAKHVGEVLEIGTPNSVVSVEARKRMSQGPNGLYLDSGVVVVQVSLDMPDKNGKKHRLYSILPDAKSELPDDVVDALRQEAAERAQTKHDFWH